MGSGHGGGGRVRLGAEGLVEPLEHVSDATDKWGLRGLLVGEVGDWSLSPFRDGG